MDEQLKRRLVGAVVLVALAVIAIPTLIGKRPGGGDERLDIELPPGELAPFDSRLLRDEIPGPETVVIAPATVVRPFQESPSAPPPEVSRPAPPPEPQAVQAPPPAPEPSRAPARTALSAWIIQVGSFSQLDNARDLVRQLREAGFDTMEPVSATVGGKRVYRVQVGPEADRRRAEALVPKIKQVAKLTGTVMSYP